MKKIIFALAISLTLASCTNDAISISREGVDFEVEFLFEKDGVKMYRFYDNGRYHYYTNRGESITTQKEGKNNYYQENIQ